jgi:hypothetical protein
MAGATEPRRDPLEASPQRLSGATVRHGQRSSMIAGIQGTTHSGTRIGLHPDFRGGARACLPARVRLSTYLYSISAFQLRSFHTRVRAQKTWEFNTYHA